MALIHDHDGRHLIQHLNERGIIYIVHQGITRCVVRHKLRECTIFVVKPSAPSFFLLRRESKLRTQMGQLFPNRRRIEILSVQQFFLGIYFDLAAKIDVHTATR